VSKLTVNDLGLQNELQSDHAAISVVGDFKEMKATLTVLFSKWKKSVKRKKVLLQKRLSSLKKAGYYCK
jgi:predicted Zn-dependent peptidase